MCHAVGTVPVHQEHVFVPESGKEIGAGTILNRICPNDARIYRMDPRYSPLDTIVRTEKAGRIAFISGSAVFVADERVNRCRFRTTHTDRKRDTPAVRLVSG